MAQPSNNGKSVLRADSTHPNLSGGNGSDELYGDSNSNSLDGGNGADLIIGGGGSDTLTGGNGPDTFAYRTGDLAPSGTNTSLLGWLSGGSAPGVPGEVRANGHYAVDTEFGDSQRAPGGGSLHLTAETQPFDPVKGSDSTGKVDVVNYDSSIFDNEATLGNLSDLGFDWFRSSDSDVAEHFAPALRISFTDAGADGVFGDYNGSNDDVRGYLIWEHIYDAQNTPGNSASSTVAAGTDQWFQENLRDSEFYMRIPGYGEVPVYSNTLSDWLNGATVTAGNRDIQLDATTRINGIEVGLGSGWVGTFDGAVDNVHVGFGGRTPVTFDFGQPNMPIDQITDFRSGQDRIDLSQLLQGVTSSSKVNDYVHTTVDAQGTHLFVDINGATGGQNFQEFAVLQNATINLSRDIII